MWTHAASVRIAVPYRDRSSSCSGSLPCKRAKFQQEVSSRILQERETCLSSGHKRHDAHLSQREFTLGLMEFCGVTVNKWRSTSREALDGSLAPQTLRLSRLVPECRGSKSPRNLANLLDSQRL